MPSNTVTAQPDVPSHRQTQRLNEELAAAQKKLEDYEDLFERLHENACENCKESFENIAGAQVCAVSQAESSSPVFDSADSNGLSSVRKRSTKFWSRIFKRPRNALPGSSTLRRHIPTTSPKVSTSPSKEKPPGVDIVKRHDHPVSKRQRNALPGSSTLRRHIPTTSPKVSTSPSEENPSAISQYFVKHHDRPVGKPSLQVKLERAWTHETSINSMKFSPDGRYLAVGHTHGSQSQKTHIYEVTDGRKICLLADRYAERHTPFINYLSFSPRGGRYIAAGHSTGQIMIWDIGDKRVRNAFGGHRVLTNNYVDFSPDGRFVVSSSISRFGGVRIWSMRDGSSVLLWDGGGSGPVAVKFSPDGRHVAASDEHGMVRLWNVRTTKLVTEWKAHRDMTLGVAFTPNGRGLVTASHDHTLKYWDLGQSGINGVKEDEVLEFIGHTHNIFSAAISPDGQWLVSGSFDHTARIWDISDASLQCTLLGHEKGVVSVDLSPTGDHIACASSDGSVSVWRYKLTRK